MAYKKTYIGKGKVNETYPENISVTLKMEDAEKFIYEKDGKKFLTFEVSPFKNGKDEKGRTHTVHVSEKVEEKTEE